MTFDLISYDIYHGFESGDFDLKYLQSKEICGVLINQK